MNRICAAQEDWSINKYTVHCSNCRSFSKRQSQVKQLPLTLWWRRRQCFTFWPLSCNLDTWPRWIGRRGQQKNCRSLIPMAFHKKTHVKHLFGVCLVFWCWGPGAFDPAYCFQCFSQAILKFLGHCHQFL